MIKIFNYPLETTDYQTVEIKKPAILLSVAEQYGQIMIYAMVDDIEYGMIPVDVRIIGTGHSIKDDIFNYKFLGTVKLADEGSVFHIFARHSNAFMDRKRDVPLLIIDEFTNIKEKVDVNEPMVA